MTGTSQQIIPCLWFDTNAEEAVAYYTSIFGNTATGRITRYGRTGFEIHGMREGTVMTAEFELEGRKFLALNGGPHFTFNPSISFFVVGETEDEVDYLWKRLSNDGQTLMELSEYGWSKKYGWLSDRYGLSWQISLGKIPDVGQKITPSLLFVGDVCGRAEEAIRQYTSIFKNSSVAGILRHGASDAPEREGSVKHAQFTLGDDVLMAMDSNLDHKFGFNEAISFIVNCGSQREVDFFWDKLSEEGDPNARMCGWLKDKYGVSWQIVPTVLNEIMLDPDREKVERVTEAIFTMKKLDIEELKRAHNGT